MLVFAPSARPMLAFLLAALPASMSMHSSKFVTGDVLVFVDACVCSRLRACPCASIFVCLCLLLVRCANKLRLLPCKAWSPSVFALTHVSAPDVYISGHGCVRLCPSNARSFSASVPLPMSESASVSIRAAASMFCVNEYGVVYTSVYVTESVSSRMHVRMYVRMYVRKQRCLCSANACVIRCLCLCLCLQTCMFSYSCPCMRT